ncbi:hypothetical protein [Candidatus Thiosymbion oneisti]|uniref:hypothetical protein n=1 Tax=Candidatus Thiosymbion oneisti TaxID=589554 RepID=UPI000B32A731|nr:hypothetical protein [Candidatus Thiosymbion oneisti]
MPRFFSGPDHVHDQNFKNLILDYPHQALAFFAADEAAAIGTARITPVRQEPVGRVRRVRQAPRLLRRWARRHPPDDGGWQPVGRVRPGRRKWLAYGGWRKLIRPTRATPAVDAPGYVAATGGTRAWACARPDNDEFALVSSAEALIDCCANLTRMTAKVRKIGEEQGEARIMHRLLNRLDVAEVSELLGLSAEDVKRIAAAGNDDSSVHGRH